MKTMLIPFEAVGATIKVAATTVAPTGVTTVTVGGSINCQFRIQNNGTETIFYAYGVDGATALANAVIPTGSGASAKNSFPLGAGGIEIISAPRASYWSGITVTAAQSLFVTPGGGV